MLPNNQYYNENYYNYNDQNSNPNISSNYNYYGYSGKKYSSNDYYYQNKKSFYKDKSNYYSYYYDNNQNQNTTYNYNYNSSKSYFAGVSTSCKKNSSFNGYYNFKKRNYSTTLNEKIEISNIGTNIETQPKEIIENIEKSEIVLKFQKKEKKVNKAKKRGRIAAEPINKLHQLSTINSKNTISIKPSKQTNFKILKAKLKVENEHKKKTFLKCYNALDQCFNYSKFNLNILKHNYIHKVKAERKTSYEYQNQNTNEKQEEINEIILKTYNKYSILSNDTMNEQKENNNYETLTLQPYTFITDQKLIEENLAKGNFIKGQIYINKINHSFGYLKRDLEEDIIIRGFKNLNTALHLDIVIVELFPVICWKRFKGNDTLRPEGRVVSILYSDYSQKVILSKIVLYEGLYYASPINSNLPKMFLKLKRIKRDQLKSEISDFFWIKKIDHSISLNCPKASIVTKVENPFDFKFQVKNLFEEFDLDFNLFSKDLSNEFSLKNYNKTENYKNSIVLKFRNNSCWFSFKINENTINLSFHILDIDEMFNFSKVYEEEIKRKLFCLRDFNSNLSLFSNNLIKECELSKHKIFPTLTLVFQIFTNGDLDLSFKPYFESCSVKIDKIFTCDPNSNSKIFTEVIDNNNKENLLILTKEEKILEEEFKNNLNLLIKTLVILNQKRLESGSISAHVNDDFLYDHKTNKHMELNTCDLIINELHILVNKLSSDLTYENDFYFLTLDSLQDDSNIDLKKYLTIFKANCDFNESFSIIKMLENVKKKNVNKYTVKF